MPRHASAGFRDRLRSSREERDLTQEQLASAIGLSGRASISALERGRQRATLELCEDLARAIGVPPSWLAYGDGRPAFADRQGQRGQRVG